MSRIFYILFLISSAGLLFTCKKGPGPEMRLKAKTERFRIYDNALDRCKELPVDSLLKCARNIINIDTIKGIKWSVWHEYGKAKALFHNNLGIEAIEVINDILPKTESHDLLFERAELLQLRSFLYTVTYKMQMAAEDSYMAADIYLQLNLVRNATSCYLRITNLQYNSDNYQTAVDNGLYALKLYDGLDFIDHGDSVNLMNLYNTIGLAYFKLNNLDSAEIYYDLSFDMATLLNEEFWKGLVTGNVAEIYFMKGLEEEAIEKYKYDIGISLKHNEPASAALSLLEIGKIYNAKRQYNVAKSYYDSAGSLLRGSGRPISLSTYYRLLSQWFETKNHYDSALIYFKKHIEFRDSVQSIQVNSQLRLIQNQKQFEKQLADINLLKAENELKKEELLVSRISIVAFVLISVLLLGLLYIIRKNYKKLNELNLQLESKVRARTAKLRKINKELDTYLYRASHDVRRPILTILGLIHVADVTHEAERVSIRETIKKTAYEMDKMLKKLQMAYELEKESRRNKVVFNINHYIAEKTIELSKEYAGVKFEFEENDRIVVRSNKNLFNIFFTNILENACIFSEDENKVVKVALRRKNNQILVSIKDNGIGINPAHIANIFDPYIRFSNKSTGSGLGLYLAMKAAKKMDGEITVESEPGKGSEFLIVIPIKAGEDI